MIEWTLEKREIKDLKKNPSNPRTLTKDQFAHIKKSIDKFGLIDKPVVNRDNLIIGGHQRIEILKKDKVSTVDCWIPSRQLEDKEVDELLLRLNRNHGSFDFETLANAFEVQDLLEWGFTPDEMELCLDLTDVDEPVKETKKKTTECPQCGCKF